jgi:hypothetical protein
MEFTLKSKKGVLAILLLLLTPCFLYYNLTFNTDTTLKNVAVDNMTSESTFTKGSVNEAQARLPNYDARKRAGIVRSNLTQEAGFDANKVLKEGQAEINNLITAYDQSLSEPEAKKVIEKKLTVISDEYKKAILVKLANDEL